MEKPSPFPPSSHSSSPVPGLSREWIGARGRLGQVEGGWIYWWYPDPCLTLPSRGAPRSPVRRQPDPAPCTQRAPNAALGLPEGPAGHGAGAARAEPAPANGRAQGKGHFRLNVLSRLEAALVKSLALLGGLSWNVSRPCPLPTINQSCSKLAQMLGDSVQIQLWFGSRSHAWLHVGPGLLDRIQPPGLRRALFPSAASPRSPHTCLPLRRVGQPGRIRHRQEPAAPAGSSHFIFPAVPGVRQPPARPRGTCVPSACIGLSL